MKSIGAALVIFVMACTVHAAPPTTSSEAIAAFRAAWKETVSKELAKHPAIENLQREIYDKKHVKARLVSSKECIEAINSRFSEETRKSAILYGSLEALKPERKVWVISYEDLNHIVGGFFEACLDPKTGKVLA